MKLYFLLLAGLLILIAFVFILPPLWRQRAVAAEDMDERNLAIARQRLQELKEQLQAGVLSQADYDAQRDELELALSDDFAIGKQKVAASSGRWVVYVLALLIPVLAGSLYAVLGNFQAVEPTAEMLATKPGEPGIDDIRKMVGKLAERMKTKPDDAEGWVMLGKSYKYLQQYSKAADAFAQAYRLLGDKPEILLLYADALAFANDEQLAGKPSELVFKALALEPDNITALWLAGMAKAQAGDAEAGIQLWRKLVALLPPGSQAQKETQGLLAQLEGQASGRAPAESSPAAQSASTGITVQVSLAPELSKSVQPNDVVFIYAQALSGPKMPLAIVRKQAADLPLTVSLTDAMAMMPEMKLSSFPQVKLLARISKSGNAMAQAGDLIGVIEQVAVTDNNINKIVINEQVK